MKFFSILVLSAGIAFAQVPLKVAEVRSVGSAGIKLPNQAGNNYDPANMIDGKYQTTWALPYKKGEVMLHFAMENWVGSLDRIVIHNGYWKNEKRFKQNSRAKKVSVYINGIHKKNLVKDVILEDSMTPQTIELGGISEVANVYLRVHNVYMGTTWPDLCISEVQFFGTEGSVPRDPYYYGIEENYAGGRKIHLNEKQIEEMSRNRSVTLTVEQKQSLSEVWNIDVLSVVPSNWNDCTCGMYSVSWTDLDSVYVSEISVPYDGDMEIGPYSAGNVVVTPDGRLFRDSKELTVESLIAQERERKANPPRNEDGEIAYGPYRDEKGLLTLDFPPEEVIGKKKLENLRKNLKKKGLKFSYDFVGSSGH